MRVHELIEILQKMEPNAEVTVGSHTLTHPNCKHPLGIWPAIGVDAGTFVHGGPLGQDHWVKIVASDAWGCTFVESQGINSILTKDHTESVKENPA